MTPEECKQVFALLSEYIDGELPADLCERIDRHLDACPPCIEFIESLRKSTELCKALSARESPGRLDHQARAELLAAYRRSALSRSAKRDQ
jgi:anti-sigma factor (TIGR02949 family)